MKVGFPRGGHIPTAVLAGCLQELGLDVVFPPPVTERTIQLGVRHSPDMMCFPYKVTLGSMLEAIDLGAEVLLQFNSGRSGQCRQKQYHRMQGFKLARLGYRVEVVGVTSRNLVLTLARLSGCTRHVVRKIVRSGMVELVAKSPTFQFSKDGPNIGIIGEVYSIMEQGVNRNLHSLIQQFGGHPVDTITLLDYVDWQAWWRFRDKYERVAASYFCGIPAGHSLANMANLLRLIDIGIEGIVHVMPLTCMPECSIEDYIDAICEDNKVPLLRLPLDETNSPANVETRVETFVELAKRRRVA